MPNKIIAVVGATGAQGGGIAKAILNDKKSDYSVRALTRDVNSEKARELAALGAEVVAADLDDEASVERAFKGAYGAFCVTFFWDHFSPEKEIAQAAIMARAAKTNGLQHVIWSTLEDTRLKVPLGDDRMPTLMGKYKVPHLDAKGEADHLFTDPRSARDFPVTSFFWDNLIHFGMGPQKAPDGKLDFHPAHGRQEAAGNCRRRYRQIGLRHLQAGSSDDRKERRDRRRAPHRNADDEGALQQSRARYRLQRRDA